ncbi:MAG: hypothetical protein JSR46_02560 [Verrucomicrobia bacterium]|nr:hypothetical protein [Verrucomicrobiota bacterium]
MVRLSKKTRDRSVSRKRPKRPGVKTGAKKEALPSGFKEHINAISGTIAEGAFIPKFSK